MGEGWGERGGGCRVEGEGEGREWDRGKVVGVDGEEVVETRAEWGRLV